MLRSGEYYYVQLKYLKDCLHLLGDDRNGRIALERLSGPQLNELSDKYGITSEAVRQAACRTVKNRKVSAGVIFASNVSLKTLRIAGKRRCLKSSLYGILPYCLEKLPNEI